MIRGRSYARAGGINPVALVPLLVASDMMLGVVLGVGPPCLWTRLSWHWPLAIMVFIPLFLLGFDLYLAYRIWAQSGSLARGPGVRSGRDLRDGCSEIAIGHVSVDDPTTPVFQAAVGAATAAGGRFRHVPGAAQNFQGALPTLCPTTCR